jgi:membrane associated rhomboid family serine protease
MTQYGKDPKNRRREERPLNSRPNNIHGIRSRRAFADGIALLGIVNAAAGFLLEWGQVNGVPVKGITLVTTIFSDGTSAILFGAHDPGSGSLVALLPLVVTLPAMVFLAGKLRPAGILTPIAYCLSGALGTLYLLYSAIISGALTGYHGVGFAVTLLGFTLIATGGAIRWPDSGREADQALIESPRPPSTGRERAESPREILGSLIVPPPLLVFPLPRRLELGHLPPLTLILITVNFLCFALFNLRDDFFDTFAPVLFFNAADFRVTSLFTSQFLHFNFVHLAVNMVVLFTVGIEVERAIGRYAFLAFYLLGGALANIVLGMVFQGVAVFAAGASGAIATLLGLMLVIMPGCRIRLWFFQVVRHRTVLIRAGWILSLYLVFQTTMALLQSGGVIRSSIGYWNHLGGMFYGMAAALLVKTRIGARLEQEDLDLSGLTIPFCLAAIAVLVGLVDLFLNISP